MVGEQPFERRVHGDFRFTAKQISVCTKNQAVLDFILDLRVLLQLVEKLPESSFRRAELLNVLTQVHSVLYYDPEAVDAGTWLSSLAEARRIMAPALSCRNGTSAPTAALIGHSHIDTAWLWTLEETTKKIARTAANQFNLMDQYPEYRFIQSAAYHTWLMEQHYPQILSSCNAGWQRAGLSLTGQFGSNATAIFPPAKAWCVNSCGEPDTSAAGLAWSKPHSGSRIPLATVPHCPRLCEDLG